MFRQAVVGAAGVVALTVAPAVPAALATTPAAQQEGKPTSPTKDVEELVLTSSEMELKLAAQDFVIPLRGLVIMEGEPPVTPGQTTSIDVRDLKAHSVSPDDASPRQNAPAQQDIGEVRVEQNADVSSSLTMTQQFPPRFEHTVSLDLRISIENPPEELRERVAPRGAQQEPLELATEEPVELVGQPRSFPPRGAQYESQGPVDLVLAQEEVTKAGILDDLNLGIDIA
ncbi:hypothetical protein CDG81_18880 [Actinopolyspora erythraea]|uniref:Uncharacterized protein n=1 Tax=Actinopolyspora erythraea TaxID=414996 RepID=A0A099D905_9ACTN|nr:hypothetical protein CDG81_18880 [Actinopolyspora erythraea]KGI82292.1 hypothetical protein IL38_06035 [Actinopolyspora erythraea]